MLSSYDATKKLGDLSAYSHQVLLSRYIMRVLGGFPRAGPTEGLRGSQQTASLLQALLFGALRVALTVFSGRSDGTVPIYAPYSPSDRPSEYKIKIKAPPTLRFHAALGVDRHPITKRAVKPQFPARLFFLLGLRETVALFKPSLRKLLWLVKVFP